MTPLVLRPLVVVLLLGSCVAVISGTRNDMASQGADAALTNADVVKMVQAGLSSPVIVSAIQGARRTRFDVSPDGLIGLKKVGVPDAIITAMQSAAGRGAAPSSSANPATMSSPVNSTGQASGTRGQMTRQLARQILSAHRLFQEPFATRFMPGRRCVDDDTTDQYLARMQTQFLNPALMVDAQRQERATQALVDLKLIATTLFAPKRGECRTSTGKASVTALTDLGQERSTEWTRDGENWAVPLSRRTVVDLTGIRPLGSSAIVEFTWKWMPLQGDEVASPVTYRADAQVDAYDDGWRIEEEKFGFNFIDAQGRMRGDGTMFGTPKTGYASAARTRAQDTAGVGDGTEADVSVTRARGLLREGSFVDAGRVGRNALSKNPQDGEAHLVVGLADYRTGAYTEALNHLQQAFALGQTIDLPVKHRHIARGLMPNDELCSGSLRLSKTTMEFTSTSRAQDRFSVTASDVLELKNEASLSGRVRLKIVTVVDGDRDTRIYNFHSVQSDLRAKDPAAAVSAIVVQCESCEASTSVIYELLRHASNR
jgi:hypothetical protein